MKAFVAGKNVEHFADRLSTPVEPAERATLMRLLVEEETKLGAGLEQLELIELRLATSHRLIAQQRMLIAQLKSAGRDTRQPNDLLFKMLEVEALFEECRRRIMQELDQRIL